MNQNKLCQVKTRKEAVLIDWLSLKLKTVWHHLINGRS